MGNEKLTGVAFFRGKNNFLYIGNIKSYQSQVVDLQLSKEPYLCYQGAALDKICVTSPTCWTTFFFHLSLLTKVVHEIVVCREHLYPNPTCMFKSGRVSVWKKKKKKQPHVYTTILRYVC